MRGTQIRAHRGGIDNYVTLCKQHRREIERISRSPRSAGAAKADTFTVV
jgi:hypothetical protein